FDRGAMLDQRLDAPQAGGACEQVRSRRDTESFVTATADAEGQHRAEAAIHLLARQRVTRMRFQAGVEHALHLLVSAQSHGEAMRALRLRAHAARQSGEAAADQPAVERRRNAAGSALVVAQLL